MPDAVVIGAGPNGLVAANILTDAGWSVEVLEAQDEPGGAVRSDRAVDPAFVTDVFSSFYPLAAASPVLRDLRLEDEGLRWSHAPHVLAHPLPDGRSALLSRDLRETRVNLDTFATGDGAAWQEWHALWERINADLLRCLFTPFPPVIGGLRTLAELRPAASLEFARMMMLPARRLGEEQFGGEGGRLLLAGNALHADLAPETSGSGVFGWLLCMLGQSVGFPVPVGGSGMLTKALTGRLERRGGVIRCGEPVSEIVVRSGRAVAVRTAAGEEIPARRAVLAAVPAPLLYRRMLRPEDLPPAVLRQLRHFQWDFSTFKVDWALDGPVPWTAPDARQAGTLHLADSVDELTRFAAQLATRRIPDRPFALFGQMTTADPSRSPAGTEAAWAYTHVPQIVSGDAGGDGLTGAWNDHEQNAMADRVEAQVERYAPGFRALIRRRRILAPPTLENRDASLQGGAINAGTTAIHQQLVFRPIPGTGRPETPVRGLFLASASAHPGGAVHGGPGANAARAALHRPPVNALLTRLQRSLAGG
ncbi:phytoene desaturase family protein [Actinacidiphila acidipaludis]|uniref:Pyridine nucleotide-disulfide oxidoreductase domain-containing protein 2 n=1 Tax=Actinacidiphila acidipaludis TaxID=2873382 RepID=A0ABS7QGD8_9ACTN|nr:NAD(P)/FAD-dependent oxidoreductase [Streptomyces acidipaludis]MBY8882232.1 NAD(P)/FAD-dependent oxidoreductase [Streptomyces acidipaludis]